MNGLVIWLVCSVVGLVGVAAARRMALKCNWLDRPNARSSHETPVPRSGGLGLLLPVLLMGCLLAALDLPHYQWTVPWGMAFAVALVSYFDDRIQIARAVRFGVHGLIAIFVLWILGPSWVGQALPLVGNLLPEAIVGVLLFLWIVGLINATNFMDGIDGIAGLFGVCVCLGYLSVLVFGEDLFRLGSPPLQTTGWVLLALLGGLTAFLVFNWSPAKIFLGDSGSTFLGCFFAIVPLTLAYDGVPLARALEAGFLFTWPFIADTTQTFLVRAAKGEAVFDAHRKHVYQMLATTFSSRQLGHRVVALIYAALVLVGIGLFWTTGPLWAKLVVCLWLWIALVAWTYGIRLPAWRDRQALVHPEEFSKVQGVKGFQIYLSPPDVGAVEQARVREAFDSGFIAPVGPQLDAFEQSLANFIGVPQVHAVNSGTSAMHLVLRALQIGPGDHVLCPDFTFIAAVNPIRYVGAQPVLIDVEESTWSMNPAIAEEAIDRLRAEGKRVTAMVVVHPYGIPAPMGPLAELARRQGLRLIEDCAGAIATYHGNDHVGKFGDAATLSFNGNKLLTTSGGGALFFRDQELFNQTRSWANQGKPAFAVGYIHTDVGYNYKLSNICAAIGLGQLDTLASRLKRKRDIREAYHAALGQVPGISFAPNPAYGQRNDWINAVQLPPGTDLTGIVARFRQSGIEAARTWTPMHALAMNADLPFFGGGASNRIYDRFLCLPSGTQLKLADIKRISRHLLEFMGI